MRLLVYVPMSRYIPAAMRSLWAINTGGHAVDYFFDRSRDQANRTPWQNVTAKYQNARYMTLDGDYDALLTLEDDLLFPENAIMRLVDLLDGGADIAYGMTVSRHDMRWSAHVSTGPGDGPYTTFGDTAELRAQAFGNVVDVVGCGLMCTLISRAVLTDLDFVLRGSRCCDWYLAEDAQRAGFTQVCDTTLLCGHVLSTDLLRVAWPAPDGARISVYGE